MKMALPLTTMLTMLLLLLMSPRSIHAARESSNNHNNFPFVYVKEDIMKSKLSTFETRGMKSLLIDDGKLYVGGENNLFTQDPNSVNTSLAEPVRWNPEPCDSGNCDFYVRNIVRFNRSHLILCGTSDYFTAQNAYYNIESRQISDYSSSGVLCTASPSDQILSETALVDAHYSQIVATSKPESFNGAKVRLIKRISDRETVKNSDTFFNNGPKFASSFSAMDGDARKLYFVFDEGASEPRTVDRAARIAQVCANDQGAVISGGGLVWSSLLKLRLVCAVGKSVEKSLYLNYVTGMVLLDGKHLYGTFTTPKSDHQVSAVCGFSLDKIQKTFSRGNFWDYNQDKGSYELLVRNKRELSPGSCSHRGVNSSRDLKEEFVSFVNRHPLMYDPVQSGDPIRAIENTAPMFTINSHHFTSIAASEVVALDGRRYSTFYVGTEAGLLIKLRQKDQGSSRMEQLIQYQLSASPVRQLVTSGPRLFVTTEDAVHEMALHECSVYGAFCRVCNPCRMCMLSRDPSCAWNTRLQKCVVANNPASSSDGGGGAIRDLVQDVENGDISACGGVQQVVYEKSAPPRGNTVVYGEKETGDLMLANWTKRGSPDDDDVIAVISDGGRFEIDRKRLIINDFQPDDVGTYTCEYTVNGVPVGRVSYVIKPLAPLPPLPPNGHLTTAKPVVEGGGDDGNAVGGSKESGDEKEEGGNRLDGKATLPTSETPDEEVGEEGSTGSPVGSVIPPGPQPNSAKSNLKLILAIAAVLVVLLTIILIVRLRVRHGSGWCTSKQKQQHYDQPLPPTNNLTGMSQASSSQGKEGNENMSNNGRVTSRSNHHDYYRVNATGDTSNLDHHHHQPHMMSDGERENLISANMPHMNSSSNKKIATVKPNNYSTSADFEDDDSPIPFADDYDDDDDLLMTSHHNNHRSPSSQLHTSMTLGRHDTRHHQQQKKRRHQVARSTSIPAQKIPFVTVNNQQHRCSNWIRTARNTYIFEIPITPDLPDLTSTLQPCGPPPPSTTTDDNAVVMAPSGGDNSKKKRSGRKGKDEIESSLISSSSSGSTIVQPNNSVTTTAASPHHNNQHYRHAGGVRKHNNNDGGGDGDEESTCSILTRSPSPIGSLNSLLTAVRVDNVASRDRLDDVDDEDDVTPVSTASSSDQYTTAPPSPFKLNQRSSAGTSSNRSSLA